MPVSYGKAEKKKAQKLWSLLVRQRGVCTRCGVWQSDISKFDAAHIIGRTYARTATLLDNGWCLCRSCHRRLHKFYDEHMDLVAKTIGMRRYYELKTIAESTMAQKVDWPAELERLREVEKLAA